MFFFFFKQKTAYEMRISDWSSDVCSSDLLIRVFPLPLAALARKADDIFILLVGKIEHMNLTAFGQIGLDPPKVGFIMRSEEHTSELQSLMRISYAVFCLKKKKNTTTTTT